MDEDNLSRALIIGVSVFIAIATVSAIIIFFNASLDVVRSTGAGVDFGNAYRSDIESTLLMSGSGNYVKGYNVINLISYYEQDTRISIAIQDIKYLDESGDVKVYSNISIDSTNSNVREAAYNLACRYIMDNQDFTIDVQDVDADAGIKIITLKGV